MKAYSANRVGLRIQQRVRSRGLLDRGGRYIRDNSSFVFARLEMGIREEEEDL